MAPTCNSDCRKEPCAKFLEGWVQAQRTIPSHACSFISTEPQPIGLGLCVYARPIYVRPPILMSYIGYIGLRERYAYACMTGKT